MVRNYKRCSDSYFSKNVFSAHKNVNLDQQRVLSLRDSSRKDEIGVPSQYKIIYSINYLYISYATHTFILLTTCELVAFFAFFVVATLCSNEQDTDASSIT